MPRVAEHVVARRRRRLEELVGRERYLPVAAVAEKLGVSEAPARRDLAALGEQQRLTRTFGGAMASGLAEAPTLEEYDAAFASYGDRAAHMAAAKRKIAKAVAALVKPKMTLFLDAGTTAGALADHLPELGPKRLKGVHVVTHSLAVAGRLASVDAVETHVLGGRLLGRQMVVLGDATRRATTSFDIDLACLGVEAVNGEGAFNSHEDVVSLQRHIAMRAGRCVLMVDSSKLGAEAPERLFRPSEFGLLATDAAPAQLAKAGLELDKKQLLLA